MKKLAIILLGMISASAIFAQKHYYNFDVITTQVLEDKINIVVINHEYDEVESFDISCVGENDICISKNKQSNYKISRSQEEIRAVEEKLKELNSVIADLETEKKKLSVQLNAHFGWELWISYSAMFVVDYKEYKIALTYFESGEGDHRKILYILNSDKKIIKKFGIAENDEVLTRACFLNGKLFLFFGKENLTSIRVVDVDALL